MGTVKAAEKNPKTNSAQKPKKRAEGSSQARFGDATRGLLASPDAHGAASKAVEELPRLLETIPAFTGRSWAVATVMRAILDSEREVDEFAGAAASVVAELARDNVIRAGARRAVLDVEMLEAAAVAQALGSRAKNAGEIASRRRRKGDLLGVPVNNRYLYPAFQFDLARQHVVVAVQQVNHLLGAAEDPWGVASWWVGANGRLRGARPMDIASTDPDTVMAAAQSIVAPIG